MGNWVVVEMHMKVVLLHGYMRALERAINVSQIFTDEEGVPETIIHRLVRLVAHIGKSRKLCRNVTMGIGSVYISSRSLEKLFQ